MDLSSSPVTYEPVKFPGVKFILRRPTLASRMEVDRLAAAGDEKDLDFNRRVRAVWSVYVLEVTGVGCDGNPATPQDVLERAPESLTNDVLAKIESLNTPMVPDEQADQLIIESCRRRIAEAEKRIAERKNSGPGSSPGTSTIDTQTVDAA